MWEKAEKSITDTAVRGRTKLWVCCSRVPTSEQFIFPNKSALQTSFLLPHSSFNQETWNKLLLILEANQSVQPAKLAFNVSLDENSLGPLYSNSEVSDSPELPTHADL